MTSYPVCLLNFLLKYILVSAERISNISIPEKSSTQLKDAPPWELVDTRVCRKKKLLRSVFLNCCYQQCWPARSTLIWGRLLPASPAEREEQTRFCKGLRTEPKVILWYQTYTYNHNKNRPMTLEYAFFSCPSSSSSPSCPANQMISNCHLDHPTQISK